MVLLFGCLLAAEIVSTFDHPELVKLGHCKLIEEVMIGEDSLIRFSGVTAGAACTVVVSKLYGVVIGGGSAPVLNRCMRAMRCALQLRGSSSHLLDEAERSLHDALCVLTETMKETRVVYGGGCMEVRSSCRCQDVWMYALLRALIVWLRFLQTLMANAVEQEAKVTPGKKQIALEAFARALRQLPTIIADNAGLDSAELVCCYLLLSSVVSLLSFAVSCAEQDCLPGLLLRSH